jgi:hypothetical protein
MTLLGMSGLMITMVVSMSWTVRGVLVIDSTLHSVLDVCRA